jgi:predicted metal-dependent enzyme (double-stranded beta helix superfamily)
MVARLGATYDKLRDQIGVQVLLFQNPQARAVIFHITCAPGAHGGGGG